MFWTLLGISFRSQLQYRASFWMVGISYFLTTLTDIVGIWVLFDRFQMVKGWTLPEVCLVYGIVQMGFSVAESFGKGFDNFDQMVKHGDFDRLLIRPIGTLVQVATSRMELMRLGRFFQGLLVLAWGANELHFSLLSLHALVILFSVVSTASLFYGLAIIQATCSFWIVEAEEFMNITTYGGMLVGQYPITIYNKAFRLFFTLLIPIACVAYYPIATLLKNCELPLGLGLVAPLAGFFFLWIARKFWRFGVHHYVSTGS
jgi:ABC-2 type transport system permease protein